MSTIANYDVVRNECSIHWFSTHRKCVDMGKRANCNLWKLRVFIAKLTLFIVIVNFGQNP